MSRTLTPLPRTQFSGLQFDNIRDDIISLVTDNPDYNTKWDDFLSSDAGRMMIELFSYIADNVATRIDWVANENWISTATQKTSIMRILSILGYNFTLPYASNVQVSVTVPAAGYPGDSWPGRFYLTAPYSQGTTFNPFYLTAKDRKGVSRNYEAISYDTFNQKYDYKIGVLVGDTFATTTGIINFHEGKTYIDTFTASTDNGFSFTLNKFPVIQSSPRVYFADDVSLTETELLQVSSFLDPLAQEETDPLTGDPRPLPYTLTVGADDSVTISFATSSLLPSPTRRPATGDKIRVFYRVGGGIDGNLITNSISTTQLMTISPIVNPTNTRNVHVNFINLSEGAGGQDSETPEHAIIYAPLSIRTVEKAVTDEDYDILLNGNTNVITAKSYGAGNAPAGVFAKYGVNIGPTEVWNYITQRTAGWQGIQPSQYNDFYWMSFFLENRFNEIYSFRPGGFNSNTEVSNSSLLGRTKLTPDSINWDGTNIVNFRNYFYLNTTSDFKSSFPGDSLFKAKVTSSLDATQQFLNLKDLVVSDTIFVKVPDSYSQYRITKPIQSYYISPVDLTGGVNLSALKNIKLNIDNLGDVTIDLTRSIISTTTNLAHPWEIAASINSTLRGIYGDSYADSTGILGGASIYNYDGGNYLKIQGVVKGDTLNSFILIKKPASADATGIILGLNVFGDTYACYGYRRLTLLKNSGLPNYGNIIYEHGSASVFPSPTNFYVHYLKGDTSTVRLGTYPNYNFAPSSIFWRPIANRVYNTIKNTSDSTPNLTLSDFELRFTKDKSVKSSLYAMNNDWNVYYASPAYIMSPIFGDTIVLHNKLLFFGIDGRGDTAIQVIGDSGKFFLSTIGDTINTLIQSKFPAADSYSKFTYMTIDYYKRLVFTSPFNNNASKIRIRTMAPRTTLAVDIFGLNPLINYTYSINGDYYLNYNRQADLMEMVRTNNGFSQMPDASFFTHFIWDRRNNVSTDEYTYQVYLQDKKLIGISSVLKPTTYSTFDVAGTVFFKKTFSAATIKSNVETAIANNYSLLSADGSVVNRDYAVPVTRSKILNLIHSIEGVDYVELNYFGKDITDQTTNQENTIECDFDEIIILHEYDGTHGMIFDYVSSG